ncbi:hypothetical protein BJ170DRAFT_617658 [Xylariales sp. AK1849]|nr:hypothetical protein BJ170DRAFT_617658 [Xylariales sp. AK1849]
MAPTTPDNKVDRSSTGFGSGGLLLSQHQGRGISLSSLPRNIRRRARYAMTKAEAKSSPASAQVSPAKMKPSLVGSVLDTSSLAAARLRLQGSPDSTDPELAAAMARRRGEKIGQYTRSFFEVCIMNGGEDSDGGLEKIEEIANRTCVAAKRGHQYGEVRDCMIFGLGEGDVDMKSGSKIDEQVTLSPTHKNQVQSPLDIQPRPVHQAAANMCDWGPMEAEWLIPSLPHGPPIPSYSHMINTFGFNAAIGPSDGHCTNDLVSGQSAVASAYLNSNNDGTNASYLGKRLSDTPVDSPFTFSDGRTIRGTFAALKSQVDTLHRTVRTRSDELWGANPEPGPLNEKVQNVYKVLGLVSSSLELVQDVLDGEVSGAESGQH